MRFPPSTFFFAVVLVCGYTVYTVCTYRTFFFFFGGGGRPVKYANAMDMVVGCLYGKEVRYPELYFQLIKLNQDINLQAK